MRTLSATVLAALASGSVGLAQLVRIQVSSGDVLLNSSNMHLTWGGLNYLGAYGLGSVSPLEDKAGEAQGITLQLDGGASARIALALDASDEVQGAAVTLRTAIVDAATGTVLDAPTDWVGKADLMAIQEDGATASISLAVESAAIDLLRGNASTYSQADQAALFTGDRAFEYIVSQADQLVIWPAREFFFK